MNAFVKAFETHLRQWVLLCTACWISQCTAGTKYDIPGVEDDFVYVYTTHPKFRPKEVENGNNIARVWIVVLGVLGGVVIVTSCIFCFFVLRRRPFFRSQRFNNNPPPPVFEHPPPSAPPVPEEMDSWNRRGEGPPEYTSVVLDVNRLLSVPEQQLKKVETPPPAYMTVAPFK